MKYFPLFFLGMFGFLTLGFSVAQAEALYWVSAKGNAIPAKIVAANADTVTISMRAKTCVLKLADLGPESRALARKLASISRVQAATHATTQELSSTQVATDKPVSGWPDLNAPEVVDELLMKKVGGVNLAHAPTSDTPYTGWFKGFHQNGRKSLLIHFKEGREDGPFVFWNENGIKTRRGSFRQGLFHGPYERWDSEGRKMFKGEYRYGFIYNDIGWKPNGERSETNLVKGSGPYVEYYESGQKKWESQFEDGLSASTVMWKPNGEKCPDSNIIYGNGVGFLYNEDGSVAGKYLARRIIGPVEAGRRIKTVHFVDGRLIGQRYLEVDLKAPDPAVEPVRLTDEDDLRDAKFLVALFGRAFDKNQLHRHPSDNLLMDQNSGIPYTGWIKESRGDGLALGQYKAGKPEGYLFMWDAKGQIRGWSQKVGGKKEGLWIVWREDGKKKEELNYKNGEPHGRATLWHANGQKKRELFYDEGKMVGVLTEWHLNGNKNLEMKLGQNDSFVRTEWDENGKETKRFKMEGANSGTPRKFIWDGKQFVRDLEDETDHMVVLPAEGHGRQTLTPPSSLAKINLRENGDFIVLGAVVPEDKLMGWLKEELKKKPNLKVLVSVDGDAPDRRLANLLSICREVGVPRANVAVRTKK